nr:MAG TPA_asm: hypothetical protein [Microviridae sp.]
MHSGGNDYLCNAEKQLKITVMKEFMIIYTNLNNGKTLEGLTNAKDILSALLEAKSLCERFRTNGVPLEVINITEVVKQQWKEHNGCSNIHSL